MIKKENFKKISENLLISQEPNSDIFRKNLFMFLGSKEISLYELSEKADIPLGTLNSFLYGKTKDINLSNALRISLALGISIDELSGSLILDKKLKDCINSCRNLSENDMSLIFWFVKYLEKQSSDLPPNKQFLSVMNIACNDHGNLKLSSEYSKIDISHIDDEFKSKVFFGINMPCEHYLPTYCPNDVLVIANDRRPTEKEHVLIQRSNCVFIARQVVENGNVKYYSIRDGKQRTENEDVELIGYIVGVIKPNGKWKNNF